MRVRRSTMLAALMSLAACTLWAQSAANYFIYIGTYTSNAAKGIYAYRFQPVGGKLAPLGVVAETPSPSFLVVHPNGRFLYAANEHDPAITGGKDDMISAFSIDAGSGHLAL